MTFAARTTRLEHVRGGKSYPVDMAITCRGQPESNFGVAAFGDRDEVNGLQRGKVDAEVVRIPVIAALSVTQQPIR